MFSFHKPKVYRSSSGCCICGAKSSSSRFTSSKRYEAEFTGCFRTGSERRSGDICNACVLLVKRWRKLPQGTDRHWQHMLDARAGTRSAHRSKSHGRIANEKCTEATFSSAQQRQRWSGISNEQRKANIYNSSDDSDLSDCEGFNRRRREKRKRSRPVQFSPFLDLSYWKRTKVCCGIIFCGANGEVMLDTNFWRPCASCRPQIYANSPAGQESTDDAASVISDHNSYTSSQESNTLLDCGASAFDLDVDVPIPRKNSGLFELEL